MQTQPRCLHCGSYRLTPRCEVQAGPQGPCLRPNLGEGFFAPEVRLLWEGSACLDCGYVMLFLRPADLQEARQLWPPSAFGG